MSRCRENLVSLETAACRRAGAFPGFRSRRLERRVCMRGDLISPPFPPTLPSPGVAVFLRRGPAEIRMSAAASCQPFFDRHTGGAGCATSASLVSQSHRPPFPVPRRNGCWRMGEGGGAVVNVSTLRGAAVVIAR